MIWRKMKLGRKRGNASSGLIIFNRIIRNSPIKKKLFEEKMACFMNPGIFRQGSWLFPF